MNMKAKESETLTAAYANLGKLLASKNGDQFQDPLYPSSWIVMAMKRIGSLMKIDFKFAPEVAKSHSAEDAIDRICRMSDVEYRTMSVQSLLYASSPIPLLAFYGKNRTPVVLDLKGNESVCYDPVADKSFKLKKEDFLELGEYAYQFYRSFRQEEDLTFFKTMKKSLSFHVKDSLTALNAGLLYTLFALFPPFATKWLFDSVLPSGSVSFHFQLSIGVVVSLVASALFMVIQRYTISRLRSMITHDLQLGIWGKVFRSSSRILRKFSVGEIFEKIDYFARAQQTLGDQAVTAIVNVLYSCFYLIVMLYFSWAFTIGALAVIAGSFLLSMGVVGAFLKIKRRLLPYDNKLVSKVVQYIRGIRTIRVTDSEERFFASWSSSYIPTQKLQKEMGVLKTAYVCLNQAAPLLIALLIYAVSVIQFESGKTSVFQMTVGDYMAFVFAMNSFTQATFGCFGYVFELMAITPSWNQAKQLLEVPPESFHVAKSFTPLRGKITLEHVDFSYHPERPVLRDVNLSIEPGEFIGIVGPTGSGKSTLIRLLLGLESPSRGRVCYDGRELGQWDLKDLRTQIGCVLQNTTIFEGSILDNILAGRRFENGNIGEAIKMAGLAEFLAALPMGLHTPLSYGGTTISLGQKQRILIARAFVANPKVILFDEATSALDNGSQKVISDFLQERNVTRIIVTHRPVTLKSATRVFTLKDGIIER